MKKLTLILAILLAGCSNGYSERQYPVRPPELADCKFFELTSENGSYIVVARCPNSTTTTQYKAGKATRQVVVVDGVAYEPAEESK